jgi:tetratricopeptide (TPR) repeat protein
MWDGTSPLEPLLAELQGLEFLYERLGAESTHYVFKHALTQDVAYDSLLRTRRQALHAAAGQAFERLYHDWLAEYSEELAHHFLLGEVWEKAFAYLAQSGDKARQAHANQEAITLYTQAIEVSQHITPALDEAHLLLVYEGRGRVWFFLNKLNEALTDFHQMRQLAHRSDNPRKEGESLCHLAFTHFWQTSAEHMPLAQQHAQEAFRLAHHTGNPAILAQSLTILGILSQGQGNMPEADRQLEEAIQISRREGYTASLPQALGYLCIQTYWQGKFPAVLSLAQEGATVARTTAQSLFELQCLAFRCQAHWSLGDYRRALTGLHEMWTKAHERRNTLFLSRMHNTLGWFHRELGALARAVEYDQESVALGGTVPLPNAEISARINLGLDYLALEQYARSRALLEATLARVQREPVGAHKWRWTIRLLIGLAALSYMTGEYDQALRYVDEGLQEAQRTSSQKYVAMGQALRGKIAAKLGDTDAAGTELQRAFTLAEQLQSPSLLYPVAYDLGHWYETTGKEREAAFLYSQAKATIEQMATAVEDEQLRSTFLQSALVQEIHERAARLGE